jgi:hypothetical protein
MMLPLEYHNHASNPCTFPVHLNVKFYSARIHGLDSQNVSLMMSMWSSFKTDFFGGVGFFGVFGGFVDFFFCGVSVWKTGRDVVSGETLPDDTSAEVVSVSARA